MRPSSEILSDDAYSLLGIAKMITKLRKNGVEFDEKELRNSYKQFEVNQINRRHTKPKKLYKITGPPGSYQLDLVFLPKYRSSNKGITTFLFLVEILSRKAFAYPVKSKRGPDILDAYEKFVRQDDGTLVNVYGDDEFNKMWFKAYNDVLDVNVNTGVAKEDHISNHSNRLGIIDAAVKTLRRLLNKYILTKNTTKWSKWLPEVIDIYNDTPHTSLNNSTPNEAAADLEGLKERHSKDIEYNDDRGGKSSIAVGDTVRILTAKNTFAKEGPRFSKELYVIVKKDNFKWRVHPKSGGPTDRRKFSSNDLQKIDPDALVVLPERGKEKISKATSKQRRRLQREGIVPESQLDQAVAPKPPSKPLRTKTSQKREEKDSVVRGRILNIFKRLRDMDGPFS